MEKTKFYEWEVLPLEIVDDLKEILEKEVREKINTCVGEMKLNLRGPLYRAGNRLVMEWVKTLVTEEACIYLGHTKGVLEFQCDLMSASMDEFRIKVPFDRVMENLTESFSLESIEISRELLAKLRGTADDLEEGIRRWEAEGRG